MGEKISGSGMGGKRAGAGRKKGSTNRLNRTMKDAFEATFKSLQRNKKARLFAWAKDNPTEFYKIVARMLPSQMNLSGKVTLEQLLTEAAKPDATGR